MNFLFLFLSIFVSFVSPSSSSNEGNNGVTTAHHDDSNGGKTGKFNNGDYMIGDLDTP